MSLRERLFGITITIVICLFAMIPVFETSIVAKEQPRTFYNVYLDGEIIGIVDSKDELEQYINEEQKELKEQYGVDYVYLPQGLFIEQYIAYTKDISSAEEIYNIIKDEKPFTIRGYVITINKADEDPIKMNVLNKEDFETSIQNTIKAFVSEKDYEDFNDNTVPVIETTGTRLEDLYVEEEITIREALIPVDERIFTDSEELTRYILFGDLEEQKEYTVKMGDTISDIALNNMLGVDEFLVVNPQISNENSLLYIGQKVEISPVSPIINVIVEEKTIEDIVVKYTTKIKYDSTQSYGYRLVTQEGIDGLQRVTQKIISENSHILTAEITDAEILEPTIDRIEIRGTYSISDPIIVGDTEWIWPTNKPYTISSKYGWRTIYLKKVRTTSFHAAIDIYTQNGKNSPIYAANSGNVYEVGYYPKAGGNQVIINHNNGYYTLYAHLSEVYVKRGQAVNTGDVIGLMGATGNVTGVHLHFGLYGCSTCSLTTMPWGKTVNPLVLYR